MELQAFPLQWPVGWKRMKAADRKLGRFNKKERQYNSDSTHSWQRSKWLTVSDGVDRVRETLEAMGISRNDIVISTNVRTRLDGLPRSGEKEPEDPGVAVYWRQDYGKPMRCIAIDRYTNVADNLAAVAATLEAMRAIERHGGAEILERTFTGFAALPEKASQAWREVLGIGKENPTSSEVDTAYKRLLLIHHPDHGGDRDKLQAVVEARKQALQELAG